MSTFNILCLHGCNQNEAMFKSILNTFTDTICKKDKNFSFHFLQAKYEHPNGGFTWYKKPLEVKK